MSPEPDDVGPVIGGAGRGDQNGVSVAAAGRINTDGFDELLIGPPEANGKTFQLHEVSKAFDLADSAQFGSIEPNHITDGSVFGSTRVCVRKHI